MSFKDRAFTERLLSLGDEAEGIFESVYSHKFDRYGLNRPGTGLASVPPFVRYTPDYLTSKGLVEVQGFGRDQTFKLKEDKWAALLQWERCSRWRVDLFVWDSWFKRYGWVRLVDLASDTHWVPGLFPEGKSYRAWEAKWLPVIEWINYDATQVTRQS